jgi:hypothetical protein
VWLWADRRSKPISIFTIRPHFRPKSAPGAIQLKSLGRPCSECDHDCGRPLHHAAGALRRLKVISINTHEYIKLSSMDRSAEVWDEVSLEKQYDHSSPLVSEGTWGTHLRRRRH